MQFLQNGDHRYGEFRGAVLREVMKILQGEDSDGDTAVADIYWDSTIRRRIAAHDHVGAYHRLKVAAEGENAFVGVDRIFAVSVEGEPIGLLASSTALMGFTQVLHYAMTHAGLLEPISSLKDGRRPWGRHFRSGSGIAERLQHDDDINFHIARLQIMAIAEWTNNHRRLAIAA